ncbi:MAG: hypothetical protein V2A79_14250 [Planctomycetota bacterium]
MKQRKKQIYACVIGVIAVALVLDRVIGWGASRPKYAAGAEVRGPSAGRGAPEKVSQRAARPDAGQDRESDPLPAYVLSPARFPARLPGDGVRGRDLFGPADVVKRALSEDVELSGSGKEHAFRLGAAATDGPIPPVDQFKARHTVSAVVSGGAWPAAFVDGAWMVMGQHLEECELVRIQGKTVVFECLGQAVELSVKTDRSAAGARQGAKAGDLKTPRSGVDTVVEE